MHALYLAGATLKASLLWAFGPRARASLAQLTVSRHDAGVDLAPMAERKQGGAVGGGILHLPWAIEAWRSATILQYLNHRCKTIQHQEHHTTLNMQQTRPDAAELALAEEGSGVSWPGSGVCLMRGRGGDGATSGEGPGNICMNECMYVCMYV